MMLLGDIFGEIYKDTQQSFGKLWACKERGNSLEIITPFATTSQKFISVFLTQRGNEFVISDGGWINEGIYDNTFDSDEECFSKIIQHYQNCFDIKETLGPGDRILFYKKTSKIHAVPSVLFDLATFVSSIVSASGIEFTDKEEKENKIRFSKQANLFLQGKFTKDQLRLGATLDNRRQIRVNAIVRKSSSKISLINYITGSNPYFFNNSISKANFILELAAKSEERIFVDSTICLIDDLSDGYQPNKIYTFLNHLEENTKTKVLNWTNRDKITELV